MTSFRFRLMMSDTNELINFIYNHQIFYFMKKNVMFGLIGGTVLLAAAVVAYVKREAIKEAAKEISEDVKRRLKKETPDEVVE